MTDILPGDDVWKMTPQERMEYQHSIVQPSFVLSPNQQIQWDLFNRMPLSVEQKQDCLRRIQAEAEAEAEALQSMEIDTRKMTDDLLEDSKSKKPRPHKE